MQMGQSDSISFFHLTLLSMAAIGFKNHVLIIPLLIQTAGRDAWMSVIFTFFLTLLWVLLLLYIHKKTQQEPIYLWMKKHIGRIPSFLFVLITSIYFVVLIAVTLNDTISWTKLSYLPATPSFFLTISFSLLCFYLAISGLRAIAIVNFFVIFVVLVFGFFVGIINFQFKDFSLLKPLLENGYNPVLKGMIYQASGMVEIITFIFLQHKIHHPFRFKHFAINLVIFSWLTLGPLIGSIVEFGPIEAARQRYPAFEQWSLVRISQYIEHVDFLSIYQWLSGAFIRISLYLLIITELFQFKTKRQNGIVILSVLIISISLTLVGISDVEFFKLLKKWLLPLTLYIFFSLSILLGLFVLLSRKKAQG